MTEAPTPAGFTYRWPRPALTVDTVVFGLRARELCVLLIQRALPPQAGWWALPGGFVRVDEGLEWAARRELDEEASVRPPWIEQIGAYGDQGRDPRERVVSVAWWGIVREDACAPVAASDASAVGWHALSALPPLAFDHAQIVSDAHKRLRAKTATELLGAQLLTPPFSLVELQEVEELLLGHALDRRNFRRQVADWGQLVDVGEREAGLGRPARLYAVKTNAQRGIDAVRPTGPQTGSTP